MATIAAWKNVVLTRVTKDADGNDKSEDVVLHAGDRVPDWVSGEYLTTLAVIGATRVVDDSPIPVLDPDPGTFQTGPNVAAVQVEKQEQKPTPSAQKNK